VDLACSQASGACEDAPQPETANAADPSQAIAVEGHRHGLLDRYVQSASLYEIHGIVVRRRRRSRPIVRRLVARILAFVAMVKRAIEAELTARRAMAALASRFYSGLLCAVENGCASVFDISSSASKVHPLTRLAVGGRRSFGPAVVGAIATRGAQARARSKRL
jgi:hypothetical protein